MKSFNAGPRVEIASVRCRESYEGDGTTAKIRHYCIIYKVLMMAPNNNISTYLLGCCAFW